MRKLRIGLVSPYSFLVAGGVQEHTRNLGSALTKLGHEVIYLSPTQQSPKNPKPHITMGANLRVPTPNGSWAEVSMAKHDKEEIRQIIKNNKLDLLHFQELLSPFSCWRWLKHSTVPNFATFHAGWEKNDEKLTNLVELIAPKIKPYLTASLTVSTTATTSNLPLLVNNGVLPPAIDIDTFARSTKRPDAYKSPGFHLVFIGRLDERKGAAHLVASLPNLISKLGMPFTLHIIGDGPERAHVEKLIEENKLASHVVLHGKIIGKERVPYLQHADLCVIPTTHGESFGMVLVEALAAGCPIIAGNNPAYKETLKDYPYPQYVLDPTNPQKLATAIVDLLRNKKEQESIKKWAKLFVKQFHPLNIARKYLDFYKPFLELNKSVLHLDKTHNISYFEMGKMNRSTFVVLHGHRSDGLRLLPLSQALANKDHVLTPNLPGSSESPCLPSNDIDGIAKVTANWLNSLKLKNYALVGLSMGGMVSIRMLKYLDKKPEHLYLYGTPTDSHELTPSKVQKAIMIFLQRIRFGTTVATKTADVIIKHDTIMRILYKIWYPFMDPTTRRYEIAQWRSQRPKALIETMHDILTHPLADEPASTLPVTYISAVHDNYLKTDLVKENVLKILPNTRFVTVNLKVHVPKGPLTTTFFKPFIDTILAAKNNQTNAKKKK